MGKIITLSCWSKIFGVFVVYMMYILSVHNLLEMLLGRDPLEQEWIRIGFEYKYSYKKLI